MPVQEAFRPHPDLISQTAVLPILRARRRAIGRASRAAVLHLLMAVVIVVLVGRATPALAVDPAHDITQYGHRIWRVGDAGLESSPTSIAQTADGQIWVGTSDGLYRFDGKQFKRWTAAAPSSVSLVSVKNLLGARNGSLYVGSLDGLSRISGGKRFVYSTVMQDPGPFTEAPDGSVWLGKVGHHSDASSFCAIGWTGLRCHGARDGMQCYSDFGIAVGNGPDVWAGGYAGICRWRPGRPVRTFPLGDVHAPVTAIVFGPNGTLLASVASGSKDTGLWRFDGGKWARFVVPGLDSRRLNIWKLVVDRQGSLWIGTRGQGLYRVSNGRVDHFGPIEGLSGKTISDLIEDREGSIWVVTPRGIEQFFDVPITRFTAAEGLSSDAVTALTAAPDGSILASNGAMIDRIAQDGTVSPFGRTEGGDRGGMVFADSAGRVWFGADAKLQVFDRSRVRHIIGESQRAVFDIAEDTHGSVWAAVQDWKMPPQGWLWRFDDGRLTQRILSPAQTGHYSIYRIASDKAGGLWAAIYDHALYHWHDKKFERISSIDAAAKKPILQISPVAPGETWVATQNGAAWVKNGQTRFLNAASGLPCNDVYGIVQTDAGNLWLTTKCDLVEVPAAELDHWRQRPGYRVHVAAYGPTDDYVGDSTSALVQSKDGRLWFAGGFDVYEADPKHISINRLAPPVQIQGIAADQHSYPVGPRVVLPKLTRNLEIDYAALSYLQPDLLRLRYRLLGHDSTWIDVGSRRSAFYTDLSPGSYLFEVTACNEDDVCNNRGDAITVVIPPAWWQTWWFRSLCLAIVAMLIVAAVRWRLRVYADAMRSRFDDRLEERTRVARDLHDTMMQTVLASKLLADGGIAMTSVQEGRTMATQLSQYLGIAIDEGRAAVDSLRTSIIEANHLASAFESSAFEARIDPDLAITVSISGEIRDLHPIAREEIYRIGVEAIRNACLHARAQQLHICIGYAQNFSLRIRDDGRGIEQEFLETGRRGHFGLIGMAERADHIGAKLTISSSGDGTEITLVVPGNVIFTGRSTVLATIARYCSRLFRSGSAARPRQ